jgi:hypothetical protein
MRCITCHVERLVKDMHDIHSVKEQMEETGRLVDMYRSSRLLTTKIPGHDRRATDCEEKEKNNEEQKSVSLQRYKTIESLHSKRGSMKSKEKYLVAPICLISYKSITNSDKDIQMSLITSGETICSRPGKPNIYFPLFPAPRQ